MKFDLKTFVTVCMTLSLIAFTYLKIIEPNIYVTICTAVFTYYFAHKKLESMGSEEELVSELHTGNNLHDEFENGKGDD